MVLGRDLNGKELGRGFNQRKDGRYQARASINGVKVVVIHPSLKELRVVFEKEKARVLREEKNLRPDLTFSDWYEEWFEKYKAPMLKSDVCRNAYGRKVRNTYVSILGGKCVDEITQMNVQEATNELYNERNYSPKSIKEALAIMSKCMDAAIANKIIYTNPCISVSMPRDLEPSKERRVLAHWEQELFLDETENSYYREPYRILLLTGMRIGEFSGLQWQDIDFERKVIKISRSMTAAYMDGEKILELNAPKTVNSFRDIPFFGNVEELLLEWRKKQEKYKKKLGSRWRIKSEFGDLVFTTTMGSPITRYNIVHDIRRVEQNIQMKEVERARQEGRPPRTFEHIHPHAFRHTFATRCFEKGLDPLVVQKIMGHSNYSTTISYTHVLQDKLKEAVERAGDLLD